MGTKSTVKFYSEHDFEKPILSVYQQYDGYLSGVGHELANWLKSKTIINGFNGSQTMPGGFANGMGCLAAQYVAAHKTKIGEFYMTTPDDEQEYNYFVRLIGGKIEIQVDDIFKGTPDDLLGFIESGKE